MKELPMKEVPGQHTFAVDVGVNRVTFVIPEVDGHAFPDIFWTSIKVVTPHPMMVEKNNPELRQKAISQALQAQEAGK